MVIFFKKVIPTFRVIATKKNLNPGVSRNCTMQVSVSARTSEIKCLLQNMNLDAESYNHC